jgi:sugar (pentulose or hexulose) kinase
MRYFLGIDLGTSYFKAAVFDENGKLKGLSRQWLAKETGDGLTCELSLDVFWGTLRRCIVESVFHAGIAPGEISALSYSSQANSFVLADEEGHPLTPIILWPDKRASEIELPTGFVSFNHEFITKTGLGIQPNHEFCLAKIKWFQENRPDTWRRVHFILTISDYLTFKLTGRKYSDLSTASLTGTVDVAERKRWDGSLQLFSIPPGMFPETKRTGDCIGHLTSSGASLLGLGQETMFFMGGLDHHCAAIGSGLLFENNICESTGTVLSCVSYRNEYSPSLGLCISPGLNSGFFRMAFDDNGAGALEWYRNNFATELSIPELLELAGKVDDDFEGPVARPGAHTYYGLTGFDQIKSFHHHGHFVRALLKSTAVSLENLVNAVKGSHFSGKIVSTGGGARSSLWVKIKANQLKTGFLVPECTETACLGAAMIGAMNDPRAKSLGGAVRSWVRYKESANTVS